MLQSPRAIAGRPSIIAPNHLQRAFTVAAPNTAWVTDITYVETAEGWLYVAAILDGWSRRVVGWSCSATLHTRLVLAALESAIARRQPGSKIIHHSDRGSQYVDTTYRAMLQDHGFVQSMSGAGNCYDNAAMESFCSTLKTEADLRTKIPLDRRHAELAVFDYIETFYNSARRHSSLGYLSPAAFEHQNIHDITAV